MPSIMAIIPQHFVSIKYRRPSSGGSVLYLFSLDGIDANVKMILLHSPFWLGSNIGGLTRAKLRCFIYDNNSSPCK